MYVALAGCPKGAKILPLSISSLKVAVHGHCLIDTNWAVELISDEYRTFSIQRFSWCQWWPCTTRTRVYIEVPVSTPHRLQNRQRSRNPMQHVQNQEALRHSQGKPCIINLAAIQVCHPHLTNIACCGDTTAWCRHFVWTTNTSWILLFCKHTCANEWSVWLVSK